MNVTDEHGIFRDRVGRKPPMSAGPLSFPF
jgi:hypothetical protein